MSKQLIVFCGIYAVAFLGAFVFPPLGVWGFLFESNYHPPIRWWGRPLMSLGDRWSLYIGAAMIAAVALHWGRYQHAAVFRHPQTILLLLFTANAFLVTTWAYAPEKSWKDAVDLAKWFLVYVCIVKTHSDRKWLPMILLIYLFACFHFGWDSTMDPRGGRGIRGGPVTAVGENFLAPHVITFVPLATFYLLAPNINRWLRIGCLIGLPLMLNVVAHSSSRGAFLALAATGLSMLLFTRGRLRTLTIAILICGGLLSMRLFHDQFWNRMSTITTYEEDGSAMGRVEAWRAAWKVSERHPLGVGGEGFDSGLGAPYMPNGFHTTHNLFFEVLVAWGWQGVVLFFGFVLLTMRDGWRLQRRLWQSRQWPQSREAIESLAVFVGLISMLAAGMFVNRMRWELWWVFAAYVLCLKNIHSTDFMRPRSAVASYTVPLRTPMDDTRPRERQAVFD